MSRDSFRFAIYFDIFVECLLMKGFKSADIPQQVPLPSTQFTRLVRPSEVKYPCLRI